MTTGSRAPPAPPGSGVSFAPRKFTWRGRVRARALFFGAHLHDAAARAISAWRAGARLFALDGGVLVVLPSAALVDARAADGEPFVDVDGVLTSLPLSAKERAHPSFARGLVARARAGAATAVPLSSLVEANAGALVDASALRVLDVEPLGALPPIVDLPPPPPRVDERARLLRDDGPVDPMREAVARALRGEPATEDAGALRRAQARAAQGIPAENVSESFLRVIARALENTGLMEQLRAMHRKYVEDTLDQIREGKIDDALRRAVPLARPGEAGQASRPALVLPLPRTSFNINLGGPRAAPGSSFNVENTLFDRMRAGYRDAAKKLEREKRFREAAFVYVELLGDTAEAVALLERSGSRDMMLLAAEIAESHRLPHGLVVRQWMVAGDARRAVEYARRHRAFADAVLALERTGHKDAGLLRYEWAGHLARTGQFSGAVDVLWQLLPEARGPVRRFLDEGINAGGSDMPTLLGRRMLLDARESEESARRARTHGGDRDAGAQQDDDDTDDLIDLESASASARPAAGARDAGTGARDLDRFRAIVDDDEPRAWQARSQIASALGHAPASLRAATSALFRAMCADAAVASTTTGGHGSAAGTSPEALAALAKRLADPALVEDLPRANNSKGGLRPADAVPRHPADVLVLDGPHGRDSACAVALLPSGRVLAGFGERGAVVVTRKGGAAVRTSEPCDAIVLADSGDRAVLVARRGSVLRLARLEIPQARARHWIDVRAHLIAGSTDGDMLFVARDRDLLALDALADDARVLWQTTLPAEPAALARDVDGLAALWADPERTETVTFDARSLLLRQQTPVPGLGDLSAIAPDGSVATVDWPEQPVITPAGAFAGLTLPAGAAPLDLVVGRGIAALAFDGERGAGVVAVAPPAPRLTIELFDAVPTALSVQSSPFGRTVAVADDRGRVFVVAVAAGVCLHKVALP